MTDPLDVTRFIGDHYEEVCSECGEPLTQDEFMGECYCINPLCEVNR